MYVYDTDEQHHTRRWLNVFWEKLKPDCECVIFRLSSPAVDFTVCPIRKCYVCLHLLKVYYSVHHLFRANTSICKSAQRSHIIAIINSASWAFRSNSQPTKVLTKLCRCTVWIEPLLFEYVWTNHFMYMLWLTVSGIMAKSCSNIHHKLRSELTLRCTRAWWLKLWSADQTVTSSSPAGGRNLSNCEWDSLAHSLSLSLSKCPDVAEELFKWT